jgi:hypothetical protein
MSLDFSQREYELEMQAIARDMKAEVAGLQRLASAAGYYIGDNDDWG